MIVLVVLTVAITSPAQATDILLPNGITVSDTPAAPKVKFDKPPSEMTDAEFEAWCEKYNTQQVADAKVRHEEYLRERGPMPTMNRSGSSGNSTIQYGGGYGMGGFGGYGGYLGYGNHTGFNYGGQAGQQGNRISTERSDSSYSYTQTYPDLNDCGGGPITIINPYCRKYWAEHAADKPVTVTHRSQPAMTEVVGSAGPFLLDAYR